MKKFLSTIILFVSVLSFAQETQSIDKTTRYLFETFKKGIPVIHNDKQKDIIFKYYRDLKNKTTDQELIGWIDNEIEKIEKIKFVTVPSKSIESIDKKIARRFEIKEDKFNDVTFITHKWSTIYSDVYPYLVIKEGNISLRLKTVYSGKDWVFYDTMIFLLDGEKIEFTPSLTDRSVGNGSVYEYGDTYIGPDLYFLIDKIYNSKIVEYQFKGKSKADRKFRLESEKAFKETIDLYNFLKK